MNSRLLACASLTLALFSFELRAHPISLSESTIDVQQDKITAEVRIMLEDLTLYYPLKADGEYRYDATELRESAEEHREFVLKYLILRGADGQRLTGKITELDKREIPDEGVLQEEVKKRALTYVIEYPTPKPQAFITVSQLFGGPDAVLPALMDCVVLQNGVLLDSPVQLMTRRPYTVKLDWDNPPERPKNWRELRERRMAKFRERLGITSYTGLYSFIYITRDEVRHEILVPLLSLEQLVSIKRKDDEFLSVAEQEAAATPIAKFFQGRNPVRIDGQAVAPQLAKLQFFGLDINDFARNAPARKVSIYQARVGIILSYPTKSDPRKVEMTWKTFSEYAPFLRSIVYVFDGDPKEHYFVPDRQDFAWELEQSLEARQPVSKVSTHLEAARDGSLTGEQAGEVCSSLLANVYRAFETRGDRETYASLSKAVDGELLRKLYLQIKQSLLVAEQGGAQARVQNVELVGGDLADSDTTSFRYQARWRVTGTVEHWGHIHTRENEYQAEFAIEATDGSWKIRDYRFQDQKRIRFETGLRVKR